MQFGWPFGQSNFLAYIMRWLRTQEFQLPPVATRNPVHCLRPFHLHWQCGKQRGRAWKIISCDTAALVYCLCSSCISDIIQEAYLINYRGATEQEVAPNTYLHLKQNCYRMAMTPEQAQLGILFVGSCESDSWQQRYSLPLIPDHSTAVWTIKWVGVEHYIEWYRDTDVMTL